MLLLPEKLSVQRQNALRNFYFLKKVGLVTILGLCIKRKQSPRIFRKQFAKCTICMGKKHWISSVQFGISKKVCLYTIHVHETVERFFNGIIQNVY